MSEEVKFSQLRHLSLKSVLKLYTFLFLLTVYLFLVSPVLALIGVISFLYSPFLLVRARDDEYRTFCMKDDMKNYKKKRHEMVAFANSSASMKLVFRLSYSIPIVGIVVLLILKHSIPAYIIYVLIMIAWVVVISRLRRALGINSLKQLDENILSFVRDLGMDYNENGDIATLSPKLRAGLLEIQMNKVVSGELEHFPFRLFSMYYKWMKHASNSVLVLELSLKRSVPSMLILSLKDEFYQTLVPAEFLAGVDVHLEGDFNSHFQLFVQAGAEDEIRQLLTPDLMLALMENMPRFSFLFLDDKLYVELDKYDQGLFSENFLSEQIDKARYIVGKWKESIKRL